MIGRSKKEQKELALLFQKIEKVEDAKRLGADYSKIVTERNYAINEQEFSEMPNLPFYKIIAK